MTTPVDPGSAEGPPDGTPAGAGEAPAGGPPAGAGEAAPGGAPAAPAASGGGLAAFFQAIFRPLLRLFGSGSSSA
jgi:hypothetical protein